MATWSDHLIVLPILLPMAAGAGMLLLDERQYALKRGIGILTTLALLAISAALLQDTVGGTATQIYLLGDWPAPFGITLVADRLSATLLVLANMLGFTSLCYATARWDRAGPRFHALFMMQLVGLNGAFLTGDLFNLFVFFEVVLAASYGLLLHGATRDRVSAGLHYISINIAASLLFLIGASLIYGVTGTLNLADLAEHFRAVSAADLALLQGGILILGIVFIIKAGMWPLGFWLPTTYSAAAPPVAALFAILSKVGVYAIVRLVSIIPPDAPGSAFLVDGILTLGGISTVAFGTIGILAARTLSRVAGYSLIISSGTLLATIGAGEAVLGPALFYLVSSSLAVSAFYLLAELLARGEPAATSTAADAVFDDEYAGMVNENGDEEVGVVIPVTLAVLGGAFLFCALLLAGLPPLTGFVAKFAIIDGLLRSGTGPASWTLIGMIVFSGLATIIAASRAGIELVWAADHPPQGLRVAEVLAIGVLLMACLGLMLFAGPALQAMTETARLLNATVVEPVRAFGSPTAGAIPQ
ncbi:monovalent cation/H+ antiporter subunit D [Sphingomonas sp. DBB INV C78]|uniref:monovalent cation/H+ antiporter subunit D n=1 Tax=Sphingomonas sp. DBB INV C78 TaxID=3349434 RepID=UPI0036D38977